MVTTELCEEGGTFCFALQFGTGCICLVLFASVGSCPSVLFTCAILEPAVPRFRAQEQAAFPLTVHQLQGAQFRKKGCCGPLGCVQRSSHGFSSRLFSCYAKQNSKHRCLTRMSCGLFGTFVINISSEHCFVALWK